MDMVIGGGLELYPGKDFKSKIDDAKLNDAEPMLSALFALDARGAHFDNKDVSDALGLCVEAKNLKANVTQLAIQAGRLEVDILPLVGLQLRVMLSHRRRTITLSSPEGEQKAKRQRLHPMVALRDSSGSDSEQGDDVTVLMRHFDGMKAYAIMTDGGHLDAVKYKEGDDGFIVACFHDDFKMSLELSNEHLDDGVIVGYKMPRPNTKTRSSKPVPRSEFQFLRIKVEKKNSENEKAMVMLKAQGREQIQLVQVQSNQVAPGMTPVQVAEKIAKLLDKETEGIDPEKTAKEVDDKTIQQLKDNAKALRDSMKIEAPPVSEGPPVLKKPGADSVAIGEPRARFLSPKEDDEGGEDGEDGEGDEESELIDENDFALPMGTTDLMAW